MAKGINKTPFSQSITRESPQPVAHRPWFISFNSYLLNRKLRQTIDYEL